MRKSSAAPVLALAAGLASCASPGARSAASRGEPRIPGLTALPATLKLLPGGPAPRGETVLVLHAARGESESAQLLLAAGEGPLRAVEYRAPALVGPGGFRIEAETGIVGYVPVTRPSLVGFRRKGLFPDPILPAAPFDLEARGRRSLLYTVSVPRGAPAGAYRGRVGAAVPEGPSFSIEVELIVHDVELPATSKLRTRVNFRQENFRDPRWYGEAWNEDRAAALPLLGLKYRFSSDPRLPLAAVFRNGADGSLEADWRSFDAAFERWRDLGITAFELDLGIRWTDSPERISEAYGPRLAALEAHLESRGWSRLCYLYPYDEPSAREMPALRARLEAIKAFAPRVPLLLTYGVTKASQRALDGLVDIWVPNLHQLDPRFAASRRARGEEVWAYACVGNSLRPYPDNFRTDWYGVAHRALGWWLWKYGVDGYLYWAVDLWREDPWADAATFPWTNGDGMLFYPAKESSEPPYPSIRAHLMRDAFEDYDLLAMLRDRCEAAGETPEAARRLLSAEGLILSPRRFSLDDAAYEAAHAELLGLLGPFESRERR